VAKAATATAARAVELDSIDRLEEKIRLLIGVVERLKNDQARGADENARLTRELDALRSRLADAEAVTAELSILREERDVIRTRVSDMLRQIETLDI
jgi:regulator of replication initiation timing